MNALTGHPGLHLLYLSPSFPSAPAGLIRSEPGELQALVSASGSWELFLTVTENQGIFFLGGRDGGQGVGNLDRS